MLTDQFLNIVCICSLTEYKIEPVILESLSSVLIFYETTYQDNIANDLKLKLDLANTLLKLRVSGLTKQTILDSVISSGKYDSFSGFLKMISEKIYSEYEIKEYIDHIKIKRKMSSILKDFNKLETFVSDFATNSFDDINEFVANYDTLISSLYIDLSEEKRKASIGKICSLDFLNDDFEPMLQQLEKNNSGENTVPTGYKELDGYLKGGYQPGRLYIFGGASGDGKSTYLINNLVNAVEQDTPDPDGKTNIYLYATLENLLDESLHRIYSCWTNKNPDKIIENLAIEKEELTNFIKNKCKSKNANVVMEYFVPDSISVHGIRHWIQAMKEKYKNTGRIRGVWIDYLDLLKTGNQFDLYRLELGQITLHLKASAVQENVPIITVTQLNRQGYDKEAFSLTQMSESIKKVEHADVVILLKNQDEEAKIGEFTKLDLFIGKNRCGPKNKKIQLLSKFEIFYIRDNFKGSGISFDDVKQEKMKEQKFDFDLGF